MEVLNNIPVNMDLAEVRRRLRLKPDDDLTKVKKLIATARHLIEARALYKVGYIEKKLEEAVIVNGLSFKSKVLRKNLNDVERVFPYVVTIGDSLEEEVRNLKYLVLEAELPKGLPLVALLLALSGLRLKHMLCGLP